jgi:ATP-dependent DNA helicase PIF1
VQDFAKWILDIEDGKTSSDEGEELVQIPDDILLEKGEDPKETIVNNTYPDLLSNYKERTFLQERAILYPRNEIVQEINDYIMDMISGEEMTYRSCDSVCDASIYGTNEMYPIEFLNTLKFPGIPDHELRSRLDYQLCY